MTEKSYNGIRKNNKEADRMKKEITVATEKVIAKMEAYKSQAPERYNQLVEAVRGVERIALEQPEDAGTKAVTGNDATKLLTHLLYSGQLETVGNAKQIVTLIQKEL